MSGIALALAVAGIPVAPAGATSTVWTSVTLEASATNHVALAARQGRVAVAFVPADRQGLMLASCESGCTRHEAWSLTKVAAGQEPQHVSLTFGPSGKIHLAFRFGRDLVYATCSDACTDEAAWTTTRLEQISRNDHDTGSGTYSGVSLALDGGARPRIAYIDEGGGEQTSGPTLKFASCDGGCSDLSSWDRVALSTPRTAYPAQPQLAYAGARPRLAYTGQVGLARAVFYAECDDHCLADDRWNHVRVPVQGPSLHGQFALALSGDAPRLAVGAERAFYVTCARDCADEAGWNEATVVSRDAFAGHIDLAVATGGPRMVFVQLWRGDRLHEAACDNDCASTASWNATNLHTLTGPPRIAADGQRMRIAYVKDAENRGSGTLVVGVCDDACGAPGTAAAPAGATPASTSTFPPTEEPGPRVETAPPAPKIQVTTGATGGVDTPTSESGNRGSAPKEKRSLTLSAGNRSGDSGANVNQLPGGLPSDEEASPAASSEGAASTVAVLIAALVMGGAVGVFRRARRASTQVLRSR